MLTTRDEASTRDEMEKDEKIFCDSLAEAFMYRISHDQDCDVYAKTVPKFQSERIETD